MVQKINSFERFWHELKRRKTIRVITVYAAAAFIILQLLDIIAKPLQLPDWTMTFMIVLLCVGFIIGVLLSWIYDITPTGVQKTKPVGHTKNKEVLKDETSHTWKLLEEPAVAFVEVNNENSLLSSWYLLPQLNKEHKAALIGLWKNWLNFNPSYKINIVSGDLMKIISKNNSGTTEVQKKALWSFLFDTEMSYAKEMTDYFKNDLKVKALVCGTQASYSGVAGIMREAGYAAFIDMHSYWEHPSSPGKSWSRTDWRIRNSSMVSDKKGGTLPRFGQHRLTGMPLTISEYDHPAPSFFCAEMFPMLNSFAAFQDFDIRDKIPQFSRKAGFNLE